MTIIFYRIIQFKYVSSCTRNKRVNTVKTHSLIGVCSTRHKLQEKQEALLKLNYNERFDKNIFSPIDIFCFIHNSKVHFNLPHIVTEKIIHIHKKAQIHLILKEKMEILYCLIVKALT